MQIQAFRSLGNIEIVGQKRIRDLDQLINIRIFSKIVIIIKYIPHIIQFNL